MWTASRLTGSAAWFGSGCRPSHEIHLASLSPVGAGAAGDGLDRAKRVVVQVPVVVDLLRGRRRFQRRYGPNMTSSFLLVAFALVLVMTSRGRRRRSRGRPRAVGYDEDRTNAHMLRAELSVLADDVIRLEPRVALQEAAREDYETASHRYRVAQAALDYAKDPVDLMRVQRLVDEATWSMSRARAIVEGRPLPRRPVGSRASGSAWRTGRQVGRGLVADMCRLARGVSIRLVQRGTRPLRRSSVRLDAGRFGWWLDRPR